MFSRFDVPYALNGHMINICSNYRDNRNSTSHHPGLAQNVARTTTRQTKQRWRTIPSLNHIDEFDEGDLGSQEIQDWDEDDWEVDCDFLEEIDKAVEADLEGFRCSMCEKSYKTNGWLLRHVRTKHGEIFTFFSQFILKNRL